MRPRQNGRHFADDIFNSIFLNENVWTPIKISLKFVPKGAINNIPSLVQIMAWPHPGDKPLSEPMKVILLTQICFTRPQWVKWWTAYTCMLAVIYKWHYRMQCIWDPTAHMQRQNVGKNPTKVVSYYFEFSSNMALHTNSYANYPGGIQYSNPDKLHESLHRSLHQYLIACPICMGSCALL